MVINKPRHTPDAVLGRNVLDRVHDEADESITLGAHALHDGRTIDAWRLGLHAERWRLGHRVRRLGSRDEQFARHAANPGTGRSIRPAFDEQDTVCPFASGTVSGESGRTCADDGNICLALFHSKTSSSSELERRPKAINCKTE